MRNRIENVEIGKGKGLRGVVGLFIAHLVEMLIFYPFGAFIFCLEITALGYR